MMSWELQGSKKLYIPSIDSNELVKTCSNMMSQQSKCIGSSDWDVDFAQSHPFFKYLPCFEEQQKPQGSKPQPLPAAANASTGNSVHDRWLQRDTVPWRYRRYRCQHGQPDYTDMSWCGAKTGTKATTSVRANVRVRAFCLFNTFEPYNLRGQKGGQ